MNIPAIGGTRGIFEIFVPGVFLLLNIALSVYLIPFVDEDTRRLIASVMSNSLLSLVIAICFGYLLGVLLRLLETDFVDSLSAAWLMVFTRNARRTNKVDPIYAKDPLFSTEHFPYIGWISIVAQNMLTPEACRFYENVWRDRKQAGKNKQFFNFCKMLITSNDERAANELYAAESFTRYLSGMFYGISISFILILVTVLARVFLLGQLSAGLIILMGGYLLALIRIIQVFRRVRIKEVETLFAASFKNRALFEEKTSVVKPMKESAPEEEAILE